MHGTINITSLV